MSGKGKVKEINKDGIEDAKVVDQPKQEEVVLKLPLEEANAFISIIGLLLVDDDRMKPLQKHFVDMIQRHNETDKQ